MLLVDSCHHFPSFKCRNAAFILLNISKLISNAFHALTELASCIYKCFYV
jgi:hypothetical protein